MRRIVVLGGGFCGLRALQTLEEALRDRPHVELSIVAPSSQFVFTPMLASVASGTAPAHRVATSLRELVELERVNLVPEWVERIDLDRQTLILRDVPEPLPYDSLALCCGSVGRPFPGADQHPDAAISIASLQGALDLHRALVASSGPRRVAIVGGGCVGVELAAALATGNDGQRVPALAEVSVTLLEQGTRLVSDMNESVAAEAYRALVEAGVEVRLGTVVDRIEPGTIHAHAVDGGAESSDAFDVIVWCGGIQAPSLLADSGFETDERGRAVVDSTLRASRGGDVYVGGDCARISYLDGAEGDTPNPDLQRVDLALEHGQLIAENIVAGTVGRARRNIIWKRPGEVVHLGPGRAAAWVRGLPMQGSLAAGYRRAQLTRVAPSMTHKIALAAEVGGSLLSVAARWFRSGTEPSA